jgi:hypothetical protein
LAGQDPRRRNYPEKLLSILLHIHEIRDQGEAAQRVVNKVVGSRVRSHVETPSLEERKADS